MLLRDFLHPLGAQCGLRNILLIEPIEIQKTGLYSVEKTKGRERKELRSINSIGLGALEYFESSSSSTASYTCALLSEYVG
jgi:hypothetical protein